MKEMQLALDNPEFLLQTKYPQGYAGMTADVVVQDLDMNEIKNRITEKIIKDGGKFGLPKGTINNHIAKVSSWLPKGSNECRFTAEVYPPQTDEATERYTCLTLHVKMTNGESTAEPRFDIPITEKEQKTIEKQMIAYSNCNSYEEFTQHIREAKTEYVDSYKFNPAEIHVKDCAKGLVKKEHEYIRFVFNPNDNAKLMLLLKSNVLEKNSFYFDNSIKLLRELERDANRDIMFYGNLYSNDKCVIEITSIDRKTKEVFPHDTLVCDDDLKQCFKKAINTYCATKGMAQDADEIIKMLAQDKEFEKMADELPFKVDCPYLVKDKQDKSSVMIEIPVVVTSEMMNTLLARCELRYEDGTRISSEADLKDDTWITAYAQYTNESFNMELQIDGIFSTQGPPAAAWLSASEQAHLIMLAKDSCRKNGASFEAMAKELKKAEKSTKTRE